MKKKQVKNT